MPGNGYPMRLLLPGYQGNMNVKFLRRIKVVNEPSLGVYEARTYSQILPDGKAWRFHFVQEVKSFITHPSFGQSLKGPGYYDISGVAYSGDGRIAKVMVSADGGEELGRGRACRGRCTPKAFTRFRMPWRWDGQPVVLQSRAWDEAGNMQPLRARIRGACAARPRRRCTNPAGFPEPALQQPHELGHRSRMGASSMSMRNALLIMATVRLALCRDRARRDARARQADHRGRYRGLGHRRHAGRRRACRLAAAPPWKAPRCSPRSARLCHGEGAKGGPVARAPLFGGRPVIERHRDAQDDRQFLGPCHHGVRLHAARHAVQPAAATLTTGRGLRDHRVSAVPQQDHRRDRGDGRRDACRR